MLGTNTTRTLSGIGAGSAARLLKDVLVGVLMLALWGALWTWLAVGVVRPLAGLPHAGTLEAATSARL
jgi:hypothetical protein